VFDNLSDWFIVSPKQHGVIRWDCGTDVESFAHSAAEFGDLAVWDGDSGDFAEFGVGFANVELADF
jgi:hypothetical protein